MDNNAGSWHFRRQQLDWQAAKEQASLDDVDPEYQAQAWHFQHQTQQNREAVFRNPQTWIEE